MLKDPNAANSGMDICIDEKEEMIVTTGYRKIPGDKCRGNDEKFAPHEPEILHKSCAQDYGTNKDDFEDFDKDNSSSSNNGGGSTVLVVILVIAVLVLGTSLTVLLYYKKNSLLRIRYRTINDRPLLDDDVDNPHQTANGNVLVGTQTLIADDDEAFLMDDPGVLGGGNGGVPAGNGAVLSYHDDSDEDLLVT